MFVFLRDSFRKTVSSSWTVLLAPYYGPVRTRTERDAVRTARFGNRI